jgi:FlgD Ig-like domain
MQPWSLSPNNDDPTGIKIEFHNLPADRGTVRIYTLAGDLVRVISFDGRSGDGTIKWDLVSRNGQDVMSGVYIFSVETDTNEAFKRKIGKFVIVR